jgi:site-specific DNA recombinase
VRGLLEELTDRGLTSVPGPRRVEKPLELSHLHRLLRHPFYVGVVRYKGVLYPGRHEPVVDQETWR